VELPLGRKLALLISGLILLVLMAASGAAYVEVERSAITTANERVRGLAGQLAELVRASVVARGATMHRVATDTAVRRLLRSPGTGKLDVSSGVGMALERLVVPTDSAGLIEVWDLVGRPRAQYAGGVLSVRDAGDDAQRAKLAVREPGIAGLDSIRISPIYVRSDSVFTWYVLPIVDGGLASGFVAQRVRMAKNERSMAAERSVREIMGPGIGLFVANADNNLRTTTTGQLSVQPPELKSARGPVVYQDARTGEMLGAKAAIPATPWLIQIAMPRSIVFARPRAFMQRMTFIALLILMGGAALAWALSRQITRPLAELTEATNAISAGQYDRRVHIARGDELGQLGDAFNAMAMRVAESRAALEQQRAAAESARRDAVAASQAKSDFLAVMSHELRTPLNAILGFSSLMIDEITGPVSEQQRAHLARIRSGGQHLLALIDEILSLSRLEAGREEVRAEDGDVCAIARETAALAEPIAALKGIALVTSISPGACEAHTDFTKLRQILLNLLSNAVKFTNEGSVTLTVARAGADVLFTVTDTGIGVASGARARIFEPFFQVETSKARRVAGTGLGLSVTRHLARLLGGDVTLSATGGGGSSFEVRIPRHISGRRATDPGDSAGDRALAVLPEASSISAGARSRAAST
jgi:signal transduction histidine kinase